MRVWKFSSFDLASLSMAEHSAPVPGPGEVLVDIEAVSLNFRDLAIIAGVYAPRQRLPLIPASDAAGRISAIGPDVEGWRVGDRVISCYMQRWTRGDSRPSDAEHTLGSPLDGVLCEQRIFPADGIVAAPDLLSAIECASLPIAAVTAWSALFEKGEAHPGDTLVVQGSGGVSTFAVQLASAAGLRVVAVSRSAKKLETARALGASLIIDSNAYPNWGERLLELTDGEGAQLILDVGGSATLAQSVVGAAHNGRIVAIGFLGGAAAGFDLGPFIVKNLALRGITVGSRQSFEALLGFIVRARIKPVIDSVFDFEDAPAAFARLASGDHHGKICIGIGRTQ